MPGPITPKEVEATKSGLIPDEVFQIFNALIARDWDGHKAIVKQNEVVERVCQTLAISRMDAFDRHLLDVEAAYRSAGWDVEYDKPAYNESYEAFFTFKKGKK
jgi:hypothetical protein